MNCFILTDLKLVSCKLIALYLLTYSALNRLFSWFFLNFISMLEGRLCSVLVSVLNGDTYSVIISYLECRTPTIACVHDLRNNCSVMDDLTVLLDKYFTFADVICINVP